jgi:hypothetical protein
MGHSFKGLTLCGAIPYTHIMSKVIAVVATFVVVVAGGVFAGTAHADTQTVTVTYSAYSNSRYIDNLYYSTSVGSYNANHRIFKKFDSEVGGWVYRKTVVTDYPFFSMQSESGSNNLYLECSIMQDGEMIAHSVARGPYAVVDCAP